MRQAILFFGSDHFSSRKISYLGPGFTKINSLAGKLDLEKTKLFMFTMHTRFSIIRLPQLAAGHVSVSLKNRQLFSWGVCWSHATYSPEIVPLTVLTTQSGLENVLSD